MEKLSAIVPPEAMEEIKKILEIEMPKIERKTLQGYNVVPSFSAKPIEYAYENWTPRKTDVFLATYPKTGTNFGAEIIQRILFQDEKKLGVFKTLPLMLFMMEFGDEKKFSLIDKLKLDRRLLCTHMPADLINVEKIKGVGAKVIYILRNPKDQIISWMKFSQKLPFNEIEPWKTMLNSGWDKYFEHVVKGDFDMNSKPGEWYPENILSWYKHKDNKTVKFVYFEDLKNNPENEIKEIAEFLEIPITPEKIKEIAEETSFDKMKQNAAEIQDANTKEMRLINMRKGKVGGWKDYFTVSQSERVDAIMAEKLKDTDVKFNYN